MKSMIMAAVMLMATIAAVAVVSADEADASADSANHSVTGEKTSVITGGELEFEVKFTEPESYSSNEITYTAKLVNGDGDTQSNKVSPSSGSLESGESQTLKVTAPTTKGTYTLEVTFTEKYTDSEGTEHTATFTDKVKIYVVTPVTLSLTVENKGTVDIDGADVEWYVDGKVVEDSSTSLSVDAGDSATITYKLDPTGLSHGKHTFYAKAADGSFVSINGLDEEQTFYYDQGDYDYLNYVVFAILIILVLVAIYVFTRPVKNYGKPKARR